MTPPIDAPPRVLIRVVKYPQDKRGELLVVHVDTRTVSDPAVVVYSVTRDGWRVEHHQRLRWQTRAPTLTERDAVTDYLNQMGWEVRILQSAPPAHDRDDEPDESPVEKRRARSMGYFTRARKGT